MITEKAYAKINWYLEVVGKKADGYHLLRMVNQRVSLYDEMTFEPADVLALEVIGNDMLPTGEDNIVMRAALQLQAAFGVKKGVRIRLNKHIPAGAGLGGGSADAACTLQALTRLWQLPTDDKLLQQIALSLGADVPYCLEKGPAIVEGVGERIRNLPPFPSYWLLIVKPAMGLSTKDVFNRYASEETLGTGSEMDLLQTVEALQQGHLRVLRAHCGNGLQKAAIQMLPEIRSIIALLYKNGAAYAQMSGAGSTVFGVFTSEEDAKSAHASVAEQAHFSAVVQTL